jgi:CHAT domain-containing protein
MQEAAPDELSVCEESVAAEPDSYDAYLCFYYRAATAQTFAAAEPRLLELAEGAELPWPLLVAGHVALTRGGAGDLDRAEARYLQAIAGFAAHGIDLGEVVARTNLRTIYLLQGDRDRAAAEVAAALEVVASSDDREAITRAAVLEASHLMDTGGDLTRAHSALQRAERAVFPDGPYRLKDLVLSQLGNLSFSLGALDEAAATYERLLELKAEAGDPVGVATIEFNFANARLTQLEEHPVAGARDEVERLLMRSLETARREGDSIAEARALERLVKLWRGEPRRARRAIDRCLEIADQTELPIPRMGCLWALAWLEASSGDATAAERASDAAIRLALELEDDLFLTYAWQERLQLVWTILPHERARAEAFRALDAIEALREAQTDPLRRAELFTNWTRDYHRLAGRLLGLETPDRAGAFEVAERMRGRVLLETLRSARHSAEPADVAESESAYREVLREIARQQRRLLDRALLGDDRRRVTAELERLELEAEEKRSQLVSSGIVSPILPAALARLEAVQRELADDEAMILFLVGLKRDLFGQEAGGAWVLLTTPDQVGSFPIPDRLELEDTVPIFAGLCARGRVDEAPAATALYRQLLAAPLAALPRETKRLVLLPDGVLHHLPFSVLRAGSEEPTLGERFELVSVPSATLWIDLRNRAPATGERPALVLADPALPPRREPADQGSDGALLADGLRASGLPYARREGRRVKRSLPGSELRMGAAASESSVKEADLGSFQLLHFAAHAVADETVPARSFVLLAPGSAHEDGLLQAREISRLDLGDHIVVLSACRTAAGRILSGEGVMSLARAFFEAGARTVVGSQWPLRDDEALQVLGSFYEELGRGASVAAAMREARRRAIEEGLPARAWAGVLVLGDGNAGVRVETSRLGPGWVLVLLAAVSAAVLLFAHRRRSERA